MIQQIVEMKTCSKRRLCISPCPENAIVFDTLHTIIVNEKCSSCGICVEVCPGNKYSFEAIKKTYAESNKSPKGRRAFRPLLRYLWGDKQLKVNSDEKRDPFLNIVREEGAKRGIFNPSSGYANL